MASTLTPQMKAKDARATRTLAIAPVPLRSTINFDRASASSQVFEFTTPISRGVSINDQPHTPNMVTFAMRSSVILAGLLWSSIQSRSDGSPDSPTSAIGKTTSSWLTAASGFPLFVETAHAVRPRRTAPIESFPMRFSGQYWRTRMQGQSALSGNFVGSLCQGTLTKTQDVIDCGSPSASR